MRRRVAARIFDKVSAILNRGGSEDESEGQEQPGETSKQPQAQTQKPTAAKTTFGNPVGGERREKQSASRSKKLKKPFRATGFDIERQQGMSPQAAWAAAVVAAHPLD
eukprot:COSAG04_NODE_298_length_17490_cov_10.214249_4_plen_108_part_00